MSYFYLLIEVSKNRRENPGIVAGHVANQERIRGGVRSGRSVRTEAESSFCSDLIGEEVGNDNSTGADGNVTAEVEGLGQAEQGDGTIGE